MAATRYYLPRLGTASITPTFSTFWNVNAGISSAFKTPLVTTPTDTAMVTTSIAETSTSQQDCSWRMFVSPALAAQTIAGTFSMVVRCLEASTASADMFMQVIIRVIADDGTTVRGTLYAGQTQTTVSATASAANGEFPTTTAATRFLSGVALSSVVAQANDHIVVEIGYRSVNTSATSFTGTGRFGDPIAGADLALSAGVTTDSRPWIEFSQDLTGVTVSGGQATETDTANAGTVVAGALITGGQSTETDVANAGTVKTGALVAGGQATEADTANAGTTTVGVRIVGGQATETDVANAGAISTSGTINGGQATETDTANAGTVVAGAVVVGGQATEADTANAGTVSTGALVTGGQASEIDAANAGTVLYTIVGGQATETDTANAGTVDISSGITIVGGRALETDTARAGSIVYGYGLTDPANRAGGLVITGTADVTWEPPVEPVPTTAVAAMVYDVANAYSSPTMVGTRPVFTTTSAKRAAHRPRFVFGGKDVTFFRDIATPEPSYQLMEPLTYGPATFTFPQIAAAYEQIGVGALKWLRTGAHVLVQRVDADDVVVATDYRGVVVAWDISGGDLTVQVGGQLSGRLAMRNQQQRLWRLVRDVGGWAYDLVKSAGCGFEPRLGPDTGINLVSFGGMSELDYAMQLCALAQDRDGTQWTIEHKAAPNVYQMVRKDTTTIDASVYFDDARIVPNLRRDVAEEPNRVFVSAIAKSGLRYQNSVFPGADEVNEETFPNGTTPIVLGDTDADTLSGDAVSRLIWKLVVQRYLTREDAAGGYDSDVVRAVKALQSDAGLSETGSVDEDTWNALFDIDVTGYSMIYSRILPVVERLSVRRWFRSASGSLVRRNPAYDPHELVRDINVDMGVTYRTVDRFHEWAREELGSGSNWVGTIAINGAGDQATYGVIEGEHNTGDPLISSDVMSAKRLKAGMNIWAPQFDGGTLFHIASVQVQPGSVTLQVDTQARDAMKVWQIIQRNHETRRNLAREFINSHRSSTIPKDYGSFDQRAGITKERALEGGRWNVFPVFAGQEGTIRSIRVHARSAETTYAMAVFGRVVKADLLDAIVPNPLADKSHWEDTAKRERLDRRLLLYAAGTPDQPCGYFPGRKTNDDGTATGHAITGRHEDDAGASYHTFSQPVLWVAVWPTADCVIPAGRIMWDQLTEGS